MILVLARGPLVGSVGDRPPRRPRGPFEGLPRVAPPYQELAGQQVLVAGEEDAVDGSPGLFQTGL